MRDAATIRAIISIARELNIEVVAQGIESEAQQALLTSAASTTRVQGFYYSRPVPPTQAAVLLRQKSLEPREALQIELGARDELIAGLFLKNVITRDRPRELV